MYKVNKKIKNTWIGLMLLFVFVGCNNQKSNDTKNYAVVSGRIQNYEDLLYMISDNLDTEIQIEPDGNGSFSDTLLLEKPVRLNLTSQKGKALQKVGVYLYPGADLHIAINGDKFLENLSFSGEGKEIADYFLAKARILEQDKDLKPENMFKGMTIKPEEAFDRIENQYRQLLEKLQQHKTLSESFIASEEKQLKYQNLEKMDMILSLYKNSNKDSNLKLPKKYEIEMANVPIDLEEDYKTSRSYQIILNHKIDQHVKEVVQKNPQVSKTEAMFGWLEKMPNEYIKNNMAFMIILGALDKTEMTADKLKSAHEGYLSVATNQEHINDVKKVYERKMALTPGKPSPNFENYINYNGGTTSLADLKGKYLYIDLWATWCVPCLAEVPELKKLEKEYRGTNLQFVSISVDFKDDEAKWRKMIKEKNLPGIHLLTDDAFDSQFIVDYEIPGVPRTIILGPDGEIIASNAYLPSEPELRPMLNTLDL
ncbi:TlpA disulfide reductase family protein [Flavivirga abyssicola]|uniref:TlpA family protein disulfide reductase n=1 Tax=Flavivirga abyssicola TaxID=3063533 RepID=UPI0026DF931B|nr:TlpA disulfide reductase family protein [Flavivirga sp. MEBiC07777]WVK12635.1 TlpA disulfide reductase family protein [Flavivirga sp. MEBiC07777]